MAACVSYRSHNSIMGRPQHTLKEITRREHRQSPPRPDTHNKITRPFKDLISSVNIYRGVILLTLACSHTPLPSLHPKLPHYTITLPLAFTHSFNFYLLSLANFTCVNDEEGKKAMSKLKQYKRNCRGYIRFPRHSGNSVQMRRETE